MFILFFSWNIHQKINRKFQRMLETINQDIPLFTENIEQELSKSYHENSQLQSEGNYNKDDKKEGVQKHYHENGQLKGEGNYNKDGKEEGLWKYYHKNGQLEVEKTFKDGKEI